MGYVFLFASVFSGATKGFFAKKVSTKTSGLKSAVLTNFIRMLFCIPLGFIFVLFDGGVSALKVSTDTLFISAFAGVTTGVMLITWLLAVQKSAYSAMDAFLSVSVLVPILLSRIFYEETVTLSQGIGLVLLFGAVILMSLYTNQIKQKLGLSAILLLITMSLFNGLADFSYKLFDHRAPDTPASVFNFYIYIFCAISLLVVLLCTKEKAPFKGDDEVESLQPNKEKDLDKRKLAYIAVMAIAQFCYSYFKTLAASRLSSVELFPLQQGLSITLSLLMAAVFFKEKIKPLCIVGLVVLFVGLLFLNVITF
jgi:drug/metabolite transporter (DMT)-like permease